MVVGFGTLDGSGESRPASDVARVRLLFLARARPRCLFVFGTGDNAPMAALWVRDGGSVMGSTNWPCEGSSTTRRAGATLCEKTGGGRAQLSLPKMKVPRGGEELCHCGVESLLGLRVCGHSSSTSSINFDQ